MPALGVNLEDSLLDRIDRPLEYGDSRSERINELLCVALVAEDEAKQLGWWPDDVDEREDMVAEAIQLYIEEHSD